MRNLSRFLLLCLMAWVPAAFAQDPAPAASPEAEILDDAATAGADVDKLKAESQLFDTIGKGVALSLAQCEGVDGCEPTVNKAELERLVATVEHRINGLVQRQSSGDKSVDDLLLAYASVRDTYTHQLGKLGEMAPEEEPAAEDAFGSEAPAAETATAPEEFSIFEDVDESLTDEPDAEEGAEPATQQ